LIGVFVKVLLEQASPRWMKTRRLANKPELLDDTIYQVADAQGGMRIPKR